MKYLPNIKSFDELPPIEEMDEESSPYGKRYRF
jgi:hypothetical protein